MRYQHCTRLFIEITAHRDFAIICDFERIHCFLPISHMRKPIPYIQHGVTDVCRSTCSEVLVLHVQL